MKLNSKSFLKNVQHCVANDNLTILESIMAVQEKFEIHEDDLIELLKKEKTLTKYLQAEAIKFRMLKNPTLSHDISGLFE